MSVLRLPVLKQLSVEFLFIPDKSVVVIVIIIIIIIYICNSRDYKINLGDLQKRIPKSKVIYNLK